MKKLSLYLAAALLLIGLSFSGCKKESTANPGFNITEVGTNAVWCLELPMDIYLQVDRAIRSQADSIASNKQSNSTSYSYTIGYINYTVSPADLTTYPKKITVDFGTTTTNPYTGIMTLTLSGDMHVAGSKCAIVYSTFKASSSTVSGNDSIVALGMNSSGSYNYQYKLHSDELSGYNSGKVSYSGNIYPKFNPTTKAYVMDSVLLNATDASLNGYKIYSHTTYKLTKLNTCDYFNTGAINTEVSVGGVTVGSIAFDFSYSTGTSGDCDAYGASYVYGQNSYSNTYIFYAMKFQ